MKLRTTHTNETTMQGESGQFSIAVNGKAFNILLDGLYTNKIRAVVRELWTNAFDSHLDAGIGSVPFDVHLPSRMNPAFVVRDYGVSLTHEQVMGLYTTIFESTKDDSNEQVGALGLGSKSPFAYSDSFTVIARRHGRKRTYLASIGADGTPGITLLDDIESDEAQGLEVSLVVEQEDFQEFADEAAMLAIGFDPVPNVDGIEIQTVKPVYVGEAGTFAIFAPRSLPGANNLYVRQGCVIYPVDDYALVQPISDILNYGYGCVIDVPIGAVAVAASREALQLDGETKDAILGAAAQVVKQIGDEIQAAVDAQPNRLAAVRYWHGANDYRRVFRFHPSYRGEPVNNHISLKGGSRWEAPEVKDGNRKGTTVLRHVAYQSIPRLKFVVKRSDEKVVRGAMRYREAVGAHGGSGSGIYLLTDPSSRLLGRLVTLLGLKPEQIVSLSSLPDPGPPTKTASGAKKVTGVTRVRGYHNYISVDDLDDGTDYYWVEVDRASKQEASNARSLLDSAMVLGLAEKPVYMFTAGAIKRYKPAAKDGLREAIDKARIAQAPALKAQLVGHYIASGLSRAAAYLPDIDTSAALTWGKAREIAAAIGSDAEAEAMQEAEKVTEEVQAKYPLIFSPYDEDAIRAYIELVDASEEE